MKKTKLGIKKKKHTKCGLPEPLKQQNFCWSTQNNEAYDELPKSLYKLLTSPATIYCIYITKTARGVLKPL